MAPFKTAYEEDEHSGEGEDARSDVLDASRGICPPR